MSVRTMQKWHGAGNDFLVDVVPAGSDAYFNAERARAICDRHTGVGADGLIVATLDSTVTMTLFNADGSLAEMSGNGIRCLAGAVRRATNATWDVLDVATMAGQKTVRLTMDAESGDASVSMGEVVIDEPLEGSWGVAYVGNPHVAMLDDASFTDVEREEIAKKFSDQLGGANVEFVSLLGPSHVAIQVFERGVGWTLACGTGSCAVAALARHAGLAGDQVSVDNPGGTLRVDFDGAYATLSGPMQFVADVEWLEV